MHMCRRSSCIWITWAERLKVNTFTLTSKMKQTTMETSRQNMKTIYKEGIGVYKYVFLSYLREGRARFRATL